MKLTKNRLLVASVGLAIMATVGCSNSPKRQLIRLPSGNSVTVTRTGRMYFASDKSWSLTVNYITQVPISDDGALRAQANEFLGLWKNDLDKAGLQSGVMIAKQAPKGFIVTTSRSRTFIVKKDSAGNWKTL